MNRILPKMKGVELVNKALEEGVISHDEAQRVLEAEKMRDEAIQVDSYSVEEYSKGVF